MLADAGAQARIENMRGWTQKSVAIYCHNELPFSNAAKAIENNKPAIALVLEESANTVIPREWPDGMADCEGYGMVGTPPLNV